MSQLSNICLQCRSVSLNPTYLPGCFKGYLMFVLFKFSLWQKWLHSSCFLKSCFKYSRTRECTATAHSISCFSLLLGSLLCCCYCSCYLISIPSLEYLWKSIDFLWLLHCSERLYIFNEKGEDESTVCLLKSKRQPKAGKVTPFYWITFCWWVAKISSITDLMFCWIIEFKYVF